MPAEELIKLLNLIRAYKLNGESIPDLKFRISDGFLFKKELVEPKAIRNQLRILT
jgi:hypothetical protein